MSTDKNNYFFNSIPESFAIDYWIGYTENENKQVTSYILSYRNSENRLFCVLTKHNKNLDFREEVEDLAKYFNAKILIQNF